MLRLFHQIKFRGGVFEYCKEHCAYIEELVVQHKELSKLNPNSVNTIRIFTYKQRCIAAVIRMGIGERHVDNGGVFAPLDIEYGIVVNGAYSLSYTFNITECQTVHPTSGIFLPGFQIPFWKECVSMVEEASGLIKGIPLVGWDVAITESGPIIIEANSEPEIPLLQIPSKYGIRHLVEI